MKYITTPIYYVNDAPHIGHAVTTLAADVLTRFWRLQGEDVFFLTGTDEHGAKIAESAQKNGETPQALADRVSEQYKETWQALHIEPSQFIRTTNPNHKAFVQRFLQELKDKDEIYKGEYKGWYCVGCEEFKTETQIGPDNTCLIHLKPLIELAEETYLFRLSKYRDELLRVIESDEFRIQPESRKNEVISFLRDGLHDVAISRKNVSWGVPLPWDESQTVYVWVDALLNYLSAAKGDVFASPAPWPPTLQLIAKDILRFHAIIWPALLLAAGEPLPKAVFAHGFFTLNGQKMSKSLGNVIAPKELIDRYGVDAARYLLLSAVPFGQDGDLSWEKFDEIYNSDLANNLGNLVNRVQTLLQKNGDAVASHLSTDNVISNQEVVSNYLNVFARLGLESSGLLNFIRARMDELNHYIEQEKPWSLAKSDPQKCDEVLAYLAESIFVLAGLLLPFMPETSQKILSIFGTSADQVDYATLGKENHTAGKTITPIPPLFPRLDA